MRYNPRLYIVVLCGIKQISNGYKCLALRLVNWEKYMKVNFSILFLGLITIFLSVVSTNSLKAADVDVSQLKKQCEQITDQQRQMAKAAGYDIDSICSSLDKMEGNEETIKDEATLHGLENINVKWVLT